MTTPPMALGTMYFGTRVDERTAFALLDRFVELGGRWLDTSDNYCFWESASGVGGQSEDVIGRWLAHHPEAPVLLSTDAGSGHGRRRDPTRRPWLIRARRPRPRRRRGPGGR